MLFDDIKYEYKYLEFSKYIKQFLSLGGKPFLAVIFF